MKVSPSFALLFALACTSSEVDSDLPPTPCGTALPAIAELVVFDNGEQVFGDATWPSIRLEFEASDADGALTSYIVHAAYDDDIDGTVDMSTAQTASNDFGPHDCTIAFAELFMDIAVNGDPPANTHIELGVVLENADGRRSEPPAIVTLTTPE